MTSVSLPSDLVMEIMSRVPRKALARFQLVSKQFKSLLSDPCFLRLHLHLSRSRDSLFTLKAVKDDQNYCYFLRYNFLVTNKANELVHEFIVEFGTERIRMLSSHHQLLYFVCEGGIHLCDPMNKELKNLPDPPFSQRCNFNKYGECRVSFGFVDATMQYKVIKWPHDLDENRTSGLIDVGIEFQVFTIHVVEYGCVKVSPWRRVQRPCPYLLQLSSQVHVNGFIYWTTSDFQIVSFSLEEETFSTLNSKPPCFRLDPQGISKKTRIFKLSESRGNLWMIDHDVSSRIMEIWKMEENGVGGWAKIHKIDLGGTHLNNNDGKVEILDIGSDHVLFKRDSRDYDHICHSIDGVLSIHNLDNV